MKNLTDLDRFRVRTRDILEQFGDFGNAFCGAFMIPCAATGVTLKCLASADAGWDHVSVSLPNRCPNWTEMSLAKRAFFLPEETAFQFHVEVAKHINVHPYVLHLWRNWHQQIELPPREFV